MGRNVKVFSPIAAHGRGVTLEQACELLPAIDAARVVSMAHRLSCNGSLTYTVSGRQSLTALFPARNPQMGVVDRVGSPPRHASKRQARLGPLDPDAPPA